MKPRTPWRAQQHPDRTRTPLRAGHDNGPTFSQLVSTFPTRTRTAPGHSPEPPSHSVAARTVDASELHRTRQTRSLRSRCHARAADPSQSADLQIDTVPRSVSPSTRLDSHRPRRRLTEEDDHRRRALAVTRDRPYPPPHDVPSTRTGRAREGGRDVVNNVGERGRNGYLSGIQKMTRPSRGARWLQMDAPRASHLTEVMRREMRQMHPSLQTSSSPKGASRRPCWFTHNYIHLNGLARVVRMLAPRKMSRSGRSPGPSCVGTRRGQPLALPETTTPPPWGKGADSRQRRLGRPPCPPLTP